MTRLDARLLPWALGATAAAGGALTAGLAYASRPVVPLAAVAAAGIAALAATAPIRVLYLAILLVPFKIYTVDLLAAGLSLPEGLFVLSGVAWALRRILSGAWPAVESPLGKPYVALLLAIVPGIVIALHPFPVVKTLVMWTAFFLVYQMVVDDGRPETVRMILLALAVAAAVVGAKAAISPGKPEQLLGVGAIASGRPVKIGRAHV